MLVFTDGSFCNEKLGYSFCIFLDRECLFPIFEYKALLNPHKTILDAEAIALLSGLDAALALPHATGTIYLISDCRAALHLFRPDHRLGPLSYLRESLDRLRSSTTRHVSCAWIKGHSNHPGNDRADALAKSADIINDPYPGSSYSYLSLHLTTAASTEWFAWFSRVPHHYSRPPRPHIKSHRGLSRLESSTLFRLRANKCWAPGDNIGTSPAPPCSCDGTTPRDGVHLLSCPTTSRLRPPDVLSVVIRRGPRPEGCGETRRAEKSASVEIKRKNENESILGYRRCGSLVEDRHRLRERGGDHRTGASAKLERMRENGRISGLAEMDK